MRFSIVAAAAAFVLSAAAPANAFSVETASAAVSTCELSAAAKKPAKKKTVKKKKEKVEYMRAVPAK